MSLEPGITETWGRGKRFGVVPLGDGQVYWFAGASLPEGAHAGDGVADVATRPRSQRLVRASARAGRMARASHPGLAGLRNLAAWLTPTPLYLRATTGTFSWTPSTALTAR